jgi:DNA repair protein RecO (recombination protein O)
MSRVTGEPALVVHVRPYRETSAIVTLLTLQHGRVAVVARGARGKRGNPLQPFNRIRASWQGRGNLATLVGAETEAHLWLTGDALTAGFYVLELINRLLGERESAPRIFAGACWALDALRDGLPDVEVVLRQFEQLLLQELGYGLDFTRDAGSGAAIDADAHYWFDPRNGFLRAPSATSATYSGATLLEIAADDFTSRAARVTAKRVARRALASLLGPRPLASRKLVLRMPG